MSRANQWFVLGDGIAREVITADIQRYLGPDALVRPGPGTGENEGRTGYWITAYRTLTSQMIQDLKLDSTRWQQEQQGRQEAGRGVAYQDSRTHAARQHWGPTGAQAQAPQAHTQVQPQVQSPDPYESARVARPQYAASAHSQYSTDSGHYTTAAAPTYSTSAYSTQAAAPRTAPEYPNYAQPVREHPTYATQQYAYPQHATQDYRQAAAPPPQHGYAAPSAVAAPGYYIASDGRQYPLPTQQQQPSRRGGS